MITHLGHKYKRATGWLGNKKIMGGLTRQGAKLLLGATAAGVATAAPLLLAGALK